MMRDPSQPVVCRTAPPALKALWCGYRAMKASWVNHPAVAKAVERALQGTPGASPGDATATLVVLVSAGTLTTRAGEVIDDPAIHGLGAWLSTKRIGELVFAAGAGVQHLIEACTEMALLPNWEEWSDRQADAVIERTGGQVRIGSDRRA